MRKYLLIFILLLTGSSFSYAQDSRAVTFRFVPGDDMFYIPWEGNDVELNRLYNLIDEFRSEITNGTIPVYVDGYSASMKSHRENINLAFIRANRVKSEMILHKGLKEDNFITKNYAQAYNGIKDIVVVTLRIPEKREEPAKPAERTPSPQQPRQEPAPTPEPLPREHHVTEIPSEPYTFAIRNNLLHWVGGFLNAGAEWRINRSIGIKVDGGWSGWEWKSGDRVYKNWYVNPEVRWYMGERRRWYMGVGGDYAQYNVKINHTGYQGDLYGGGITGGYQARLGRRLSMDFNIGLGYQRLEYDSFSVIQDTRVYKEKGLTKNWFGPTQAGVSLVWRFGSPVK